MHDISPATSMTWISTLSRCSGTSTMIGMCGDQDGPSVGGAIMTTDHRQEGNPETGRHPDTVCKASTKTSINEEGSLTGTTTTPRRTGTGHEEASEKGSVLDHASARHGNARHGQQSTIAGCRQTSGRPEHRHADSRQQRRRLHPILLQCEV